MAEKNKTDAVKTVVKEVAKDSVAAAGGLVGIIALAKKYFFPNNSSDASPGTEGLQADKLGRGQADEALFYEAVAEAAKKIEPDNRDARNLLVAEFFIIFNALPPSTRKNAILCLGLSESKTENKDKDGVVTIKMSNTRGTTILESWLQMDAPTLKLALAAPVQTLDISKERFQKVSDFCAEMNTAFETKRGGVSLPKSETLEEKRKKNGTNPFSSLFGGKK